MILNSTQSAAVDSLLRHVRAMTVDGATDQPLTLLAVALVLSCQLYGIGKDDALTVLGGIFDDNAQTLSLLSSPSSSLH